MRVILFILGLLFSADGIYRCDRYYVYIMEYVLRCVQNKRLFEVYKRSVYVRNDCTCGLFGNYMRCRKK